MGANRIIISLQVVLLTFSLVLPTVVQGAYFNCNEIDYFSDGCPEKSKKQQKEKSQEPANDNKPSKNQNLGLTISSNKSLSIGIGISNGNSSNKAENQNVVTQEEINEYIRLFGNPVVNSNGEVNYKLPSIPVLKYTVHPTKENALRVARWYKERSERVLTMMKTIKEVTTEKEYPEIQMSDLKKVVFYFSPTCPYSKAMVPQLNKISEYAKVIGYTDSRDINALMAFNETLKPAFKIYRVPRSTFIDKSITSVPTMIWVTEKGGFKTVGYKQYITGKGTMDLKYPLSNNSNKTSCK